MLSFVSSVVRVGVEPRPRRVEALLGGGSPRFHLVGLLDAAGREAKGRVRPGIRSSELTFPGRQVVVNLEESSLILERHVMEAIAYRSQP